jgi:uncharacterized protein (DUF1778 family)
MAAVAKQSDARPGRHRSKLKAKTTKRKASAQSGAERVAVATDKGGTLNFRIDPATRSLIDLAASVLGQTRTDFVLTTMREKSTEVLLSQRLFALNETDWDAFVAVLDNPPPPNAKLRALLAREPIWDRQAR